MPALVMAMLLTGAGALAEAQSRAEPMPMAGTPSPRPAPGARPPQPFRHDLNAYFTPADYPAVRMRPDELAPVGFRLAIGADGAVTACTLTDRSRHAPLNEATCRVLQARARFIAAVDAEGRPVAGTYGGSIYWRIPPPRTALPPELQGQFVHYLSPADYPVGALPPGGEGLVGFRLDVDHEGRVSACTITVPSGAPALDQATCRALSQRARYLPARDTAGRPVAGTAEGRILWDAPGAAGAPAQPLGVVPVPMAVPPPPAPPGTAAIAGRVAPPQRARANLNAWFSVDDYPAAALRAGHEGTTGFRLTIGPNGRVTDCRYTESSGSALLDLATCRILRSRARYIPARGPDGAPVEGHDMGRVTWRLPEDLGRAGLPMPQQTARLLNADAGRPGTVDAPGGRLLPWPVPTQLRVAIGVRGRVVGCEVSRRSGWPALDAEACRVYSLRARYAPALDATGAAMCDLAWVELVWPSNGSPKPIPLPPPEQGQGPALSPPLRQQLAGTRCPGWRPL